MRRESLGFAQFSAIYQSISVVKSTRLSIGLVQIEDQFGNISGWTVTEDTDALWLTKKRPVLFPHNQLVQIIKTFDGRISLRSSIGT